MTYGNSLGVSNEYHWVGLDFFTDSSFVLGILKIEAAYAWVWLGLIAGAFAIWRGYRETALRHALGWMAAILLFYIVAARTTSESWAYYYHVFSVAPVAFIFGSAMKKLADYLRQFADGFSTQSQIANLGRIATAIVVAAAIFGSLMFAAVKDRAKFLEHRIDDEAYLFAGDIKSRLTAAGPIVASGGRCRDEKGYQMAYNASYMFYWLERRGWNVCIEDQSIAKIRDLRSQGAVYFVGRKMYMKENPEFERDMRAEFRVMSETDEDLLFDMTSAKLPPL